MYELPMFPLEQTVLPTAVVPLHLFEPRYRRFAADVTPRTDPEFGITPIERGREVGGDDVRADVGVVARVIHAEELPDGRWSLVALATRRIRVHEWLADDPYPRAMVEDWPDVDIGAVAGADSTALSAALARIVGAVERLQPGRTVPAPSLSADLAQATWEAAVFAQLSAYDALRLLRVPAAAARLEIAGDLLRDRAEMLEALADERG